MKNFTTLVLIALGLWFGLKQLESSSGSSKSGTISGFLTHYDVALTRAKTTNKPVIVIFSADWCPPCRQMKKEVYPSPQVAALKDQFVWAYLDIDQPSNRSAAAKHSVQGIPHIQFLNPNGRDLGKVVGGTSASAFASQLKSVLASNR
jgi:thiol:disulfide interchange protein